VAGRQGPGLEQLHGPHHLGLHVGPHAGGVALHQGVLDLVDLPGRDAGACQGAEAGRHAVHDPPLGDRPLDGEAGRRHAVVEVVGHLHRLAVAGHGDDLGDGQGTAAEDDHPGILSRSAARAPVAWRSRRSAGTLPA
jgi:hypothetical protein